MGKAIINDLGDELIRGPIKKQKPVPIPEPIPDPVPEPEPIKMLITQHFHWNDSDVHQYVQAYVGGYFGDILKTEDEWILELAKGL